MIKVTALFLIVVAVIVIVMVVVQKQDMFLQTADNVKIAYDWYEAASPRGYLVLAHMMPAAKESWRNLASRLQKEGYSSVAIDLRGHGTSTGGPNGYQRFTDEDHQKSILDLETAAEFLKNKGAKPENIFFIGASIGANLSLRYLADHPELKKAALLSAGLNYRGIESEPLLKKLKSDQKILAIASRDDGNNAAENERLFGPNNPNLIIYERGGHGTDILDAQPDLSKKILNFLNGY